MESRTALSASSPLNLELHASCVARSATSKAVLSRSGSVFRMSELANTSSAVYLKSGASISMTVKLFLIPVNLKSRDFFNHEEIGSLPVPMPLTKSNVEHLAVLISDPNTC